MDSLNTKIFDVVTYKSEAGFLPVIPQSAKYNVCKYYLDFLLDIKSEQTWIIFLVTVTKTSFISFLR